MTEHTHPVALTMYRVFAVNEVEGVLSVHEIECTDDDSAVEIAQSLPTEGCGIEVWDIGRRIC